MDLDRVRPRSAVARKLTTIACWSVPGVAAAVGSMRGWTPLWAVAGGLAVAVFLDVKLLPKGDAGAPAWWDTAMTVGMYLAALTFAGSMAVGARLIALDLWGEPAEVRVVAEQRHTTEHRGRVDDDFCYRVRRIDGSLVPGTICREDRSASLDQPVTVVLDPVGLSGPETPAAVAGAGTPRTVAAISFAVLCLFGAAANWGALPQRSRPAPPRPGSRPLSRRPGRPRSPRPRGRGPRPGEARRR